VAYSVGVCLCSTSLWQLAKRVGNGMLWLAGAACAHSTICLTKAIGHPGYRCGFADTHRQLHLPCQPKCISTFCTDNHLQRRLKHVCCCLAKKDERIWFGPLSPTQVRLVTWPTCGSGKCSSGRQAYRRQLPPDTAHAPSAACSPEACTSRRCMGAPLLVGATLGE